MAKFEALQAEVSGTSIELSFSTDSTGVLGWQVFDPETGAFLFEGEWTETRTNPVQIRVNLPAEEGPYRVRVAPVEDRSRFIQIDARVEDSRLQMDPPSITSAAALRLSRTVRAIPKAIVYPARSLWQNHKLIQSMVRRDILTRYKGSFGGALWTLLNPLLLLSTYFFVFGVVFQAKFAGDSSRWGYVLYFLAGMLPWLAFAEAVGRSASVILEYRNFVKKLVFPLDTLPVNLVLAGAVTEMIGLAIFLSALLLIRHALPVTVLWFPMLLVPQLLFTAGLCWFLAALGVFARDLGQIIGFLLTLWLYLTPIFYPETQVPAVAARFLPFNPMWLLVRGYRAIFLEGRAPDALFVMWIGSLLIAILGYAWFHRLRRSFADTI
jgi:lipopolysaccharide transport system permease protein